MINDAEVHKFEGKMTWLEIKKAYEQVLIDDSFLKFQNFIQSDLDNDQIEISRSFNVNL